MNRIIKKINSQDQKSLLYEEWLLTNGLGGFSSSSLCGAPMRKYHALLVAALPAPYGRTIMLNYAEDVLVLSDKREIPLSILRHNRHDIIDQFQLTEFRLEDGLPIWRYEIDDIVLEKSLLLIHKQNTLHISYELISAQQPVEIKWRPFLHFRTNEQPVNSKIPDEAYIVHARESHYEIQCPLFPPLRIYNASNHTFTLDSKTLESIFYEMELQRGYESIGNLTSPGYFSGPIQPQKKLTFIASTEPWNSILAMTSKEAWITERQRRKGLLKMAGTMAYTPTAARLILAADQFIITPRTRHEDMIRLEAAGEEANSIIAGYPWFTDWGRDTMISLEGLTLTTGREKTAYSILHTFAYYIKDGLIPNMFPDGEKQGLYNTADATLWFFHAVDRYIEITKDDDILEFLLPKFIEIINYHLQGTHFGIKVDHDGLLRQGEEGIQLTWMDAKVGDWVVTPRRGKAVEINALWYNALKLLETWTGKPLEIAQKCYESFNKSFWFEEGHYLYDVIDGENGNDSSLRPNQILAISLKNPVLEQSRWHSVLNIVHKELLTPVGLRTLNTSHPDFRETYDGDLRARDAAYHQGTVWPWLLGAFIDAWLKVHPNDIKNTRQFLVGLEKHLDENCLGTIGEIFDAQDPYLGRGCFAQAWSVAEFLRCLVKVYPSLQK